MLQNFTRLLNYSLSLHVIKFFDFKHKNILKFFVIFCDFEHQYSYRQYSYYEKCVTDTPQKVAESHYSVMTQRPDK